jgi:hypothetical protein
LSDTTSDTLAQKSLPLQGHTSFDALAESHGHQVHDRAHEDEEHHCEIENEQSASSPSEPTKQELNENFARTINLWSKTGSHMSKEQLCI